MPHHEKDPHWNQCSLGAVAIPRIFHQLWVGPNPFPEEFARYQQTWVDHHPGWTLRFWTEDNLPEGCRRPEVYEKLRAPWVRTDILRLEVVWRFGGIHVDTDFECLRSIEPLLDGVDFFTAYMEPTRTNFAIMGAVPGHPIVDRALVEVTPDDTFVSWHKNTTGPLFFDRIVKEFPEATIFPKDFFFGTSEESRKVAYAIHHEAGAWKDPAVYRSEIEKLKRQVEKTEEKAERWKRRYLEAEARLERVRRPLAPLLRLRRLVTRR
jgi:inositol phosphorylceramide mannosyltransferase catalytic subunit